MMREKDGEEERKQNEQSNPVETRVREVVDRVPRQLLSEEVLRSSESSCDHTKATKKVSEEKKEKERETRRIGNEKTSGSSNSPI